jgi:uncharacterized protein (DUF1697 family)
VNEHWVALLRGINVGGHNRVPMAELRAVLETAGYESVRTYIASGNVLFTGPAQERDALARAVELIVSDAFRVSSTIVLRTFDEIREVAGSQPLGPDASGLHVTFLADAPDGDAVKRLAAVDIAPDELAVVGSDVFIRYPNGVQGARLSGPLLERHLGPGTSRNWRTVTKLAELASV